MIRKATKQDIDGINKLLYQIDKLHADIRPDIFAPSGKKYTDEELADIIEEGKDPIYVYEENGEIKGHLFCIIKIREPNEGRKGEKEFYIDDICVDENARGQGIGKALFDFAKALAASEACDAITLNVWNGNDDAEAFYKKMGMSVRKTKLELKI